MTANIVSGLALAIALLLAPSTVPLEMHQQSGDPYPQNEQREQLDSHSMLEILPVSYIGCWRGVVASPDTTQDLNGCLSGPFVPEMYTLCYRKKLTGKFEVTFSGVQLDSAVPPEYQISGTSGKVKVLASDGIARVKLRSSIHFDQAQKTSSAPNDSKWSMDELTDLTCEIKDGGMEVTAAYTETSDGAACFKGTWHTLFRRSDN